MKFKKSQSGMLTIDFLLAFTMSMGFAAILFSICFSLAVVEVTQYIAYASSRSYYGANVNRDAQTSAGQAKFEALAGNPAFQNLFSNGWYELGTPEFEDHGDTYGYAVLNPGDSPLFTGVRVLLNLKILSFNWPLLGSTGDENTFKAYVTSFIGREPSLQECSDFTGARFERILAIDGRFSQVGANNYYVMMDNGC